MAYQALYNKYRPQTFDQVVGQKAIIKTLKNSLKENKVAHGYLFCGPRGTGKTSMARLFAKALNCKEGIGVQCLDCESCKAVANGSHPDVIEIDAASNSGVENVRDLVTQVNYQPLMGRYKVYIIDECHNMTEPAFNALLKTLEEPPSYVVFILCTTEPQEILPTILSRVQRFDFSKVEDNELGKRIEDILQEEKVSYDAKAVRKIVELADGGVRDALSILDQAVSYGGDKVDEKVIETLFGLLDIENKIKIVKHAHEGKLSELLTLARSFYEKGMDVVRVSKELECIYKDLIIKSFGGDEKLIKELTLEQAEELKDISRKEAENDIQEIIKAERDYRYAQDLMDTFEMALIRICSVEEKEEAKPQAEIEPKKEKVVQTVQTEDVLSAFTPLEEPKQEPVEKPIVKEEFKKEAEEEKYSTDFLLNILQQGDKTLKNSIIENWDFLNSPDAKYDEALNNLQRAVVGALANCVMILHTDKSKVFQYLSNSENQKLVECVLKENYNKDYKIIVLTTKRFNDLIDEFRKRSREKTLPPKTPILLDKKECDAQEEETNASRFLDELKGGL